MGNCARDEDTTAVEMRILRLWYSDHHDTCDIARIVGVKESEIYSLLPRLREQRRRDNGSNRSS